MTKILIFRILITAAAIVLLFWDICFWIIGRHETLPEQHKRILLIGTLVWIGLVLVDRDRDDDWAGQV